MGAYFHYKVLISVLMMTHPHHVESDCGLVVKKGALCVMEQIQALRAVANEARREIGSEATQVVEFAMSWHRYYIMCIMYRCGRVSAGYRLRGVLLHGWDLWGAAGAVLHVHEQLLPRQHWCHRSGGAESPMGQCSAGRCRCHQILRRCGCRHAHYAGSIHDFSATHFFGYQYRFALWQDALVPAVDVFSQETAKKPSLGAVAAVHLAAEKSAAGAESTKVIRNKFMFFFFYDGNSMNV